MQTTRTIVFNNLARSLIICALSAVVIYITLLPRHILTDFFQLPAYDTEFAQTICFLCVIWAVFRYKYFSESLIMGWPMLLLIAVCLISNHTDANNTSLVFIAETFVGFVIAVEYPGEKQFRIYATSFAGLILLNYIAFFVLPDIGITSGSSREELKHLGYWRGMFWHKNELGGFAGIAFVFFLYRSLTNEKYKLLFILFTALSLVLLVGAKSVTAIMAASAACIAMAMLLYANKRSWIKYTLIGIGAGFCIVVIFCTFIMHLGILPSWMVKEPTLSVRTYIWKETLLCGLNHPWLGYGLSFWQSDDARSIIEHLRFNPWIGDNGYVDAFISTGCIGLGLLLFIMLRDYLRAKRIIKLAAHSSQKLFANWVIIFLVYFLVENMASTITIRQHNLFWVLWIALTFSTTLGDFRYLNKKHPQSAISS